jgi:hypothetical protein
MPGPAFDEYDDDMPTCSLCYRCTTGTSEFCPACHRELSQYSVPTDLVGSRAVLKAYRELRFASNGDPYMPWPSDAQVGYWGRGGSSSFTLDITTHEFREMTVAEYARKKRETAMPIQIVHDCWPPDNPRIRQLPSYRTYHQRWMETGDPANLAKALAVAGNEKAIDKIMASQASYWAQKYDCGRDRRRVRVARICPCEACQQFVTDSQHNPWAWWDSISNEMQNAIGGVSILTAFSGGVWAVALGSCFGWSATIGGLITFVLSIAMISFVNWRMP